MRTLGLLLILAGCAANAPAPEAAMTFRTAASGQNARQKQERTTSMALFSDVTLRKIWPTMIGGVEPPAVDFEKEMLVVLLAGSRPTGGWSIEPRAVSVAADGWLDVDAEIRRPPPDAIVTQAFTSPWVAVAVEKREIKGIRWHPE